MFIHFEILVRGNDHERIEMMVSSPKEAVNLFVLFESTPNIIAWKCLSHKPEDFGCAPAESGAWKKLRLNGYLKEDFIVEYTRPSRNASSELN